MKKWLTLFLLAVTMTATFYPCCRKDCCNDELASNAPNHENHKSKGNCSPFVTCGTCPGFIQTYKIADLPMIKEEKLVHHSSVISLTLTTYTASLLQPPRSA